MKLGYSILADLIAIMIFLYIPAIYFIKPKKGNRYVNYVFICLLYWGWDVFFRYVYLPPISFLYTIASWIYTYILFALIYKGSVRRKLLCTVSIVVITILTEIIGLILLTSVFARTMDWYIYVSNDNAAMTNAARILGNLIAQVLNLVYALIYLCVVRKKRIKILWGLLLLPAYQFFLMIGYFAMCSNFSERTAKIGIAMAVFNVILDGMILYLLEGIFKKIDVQEELLLLRKKQQDELDIYQKEAQSTEEMRLIRHDFANQLQTMYGMMEEGRNVEKVKKMLDQMKQNLEEQR